MLLVTGQAIARRESAVLKHERAALFGMAGQTGRLAGRSRPQVLSAGTAVRLMA